MITINWKYRWLYLLVIEQIQIESLSFLMVEHFNFLS
jgi:hypothetical protein